MKNTLLYILVSAVSLLGFNVYTQPQTILVPVIISDEEAEKIEAWKNKAHMSELSDAEKISMLSAIRGRNTKEYKELQQIREQSVVHTKTMKKYQDLCDEDTRFLKRFFNESCQTVDTLKNELRRLETKEEELKNQALSSLDYRAMQAHQLVVDVSKASAE